MGLVRCRFHGKSPIGFVSKEVAKAVLADMDPKLVRIAQMHLHIEGTSPSVHPVDQGYLDDVRARYGMAPTDSGPIVGDRAFEVLCELDPVCARCLDRWLGNATRAL